MDDYGFSCAINFVYMRCTSLCWQSLQKNWPTKNNVINVIGCRLHADVIEVPTDSSELRSGNARETLSRIRIELTNQFLSYLSLA